MKKVDLVIIGFGKAGKTLAVSAKKQGKNVILIEKDPNMFGGTCINVGCIPSKKLKFLGEKEVDLESAFKRKGMFIDKLRQKNELMLVNQDIEIIVGEARFNSENSIVVNDEVIEFTNAVINTGSKPLVLDFPGSDHENVVDSNELLSLNRSFKSLTVIGGGYIGLEMASIMASYGVKVTVVERNEVLSKHDVFVREKVKEVLSQKVTIVEQCIIDSYDGKNLNTNQGVFESEVVLVAVSRIPDTEALNLSQANIAYDDRGYIQVDDRLRTTNSSVFAVGDVKKDFAFTYISLDDFRIVNNTLFGNQTRKVTDRGAVISSLFIDPVFSWVGLTEEEAKQQNIPVRIATFDMANSVKANLLERPVGFLRAIIHKETNSVLGAYFFCDHSEEFINLMKMAIDLKVDYHYFQSMLLTHPTIIESLNDLFNENNIQ